MSILVKGWQMPRDCKHCKIALYDEVYGTICPFSGIAFEADRKRQETCPLVEVPVRHGKWKCTYSPNGFLLEQTCSECGLTFEEPSGVDYNYCPNCGARMDAE